MLGAFHLGGILPILPYFVKDGFISSSAAIGMTIGLSLTFSFVLAAIKSRMAKTNWVRGGIEMAGVGTGVALVDFGIGSELNKVGLVQILSFMNRSYSKVNVIFIENQDLYTRMIDNTLYSVHVDRKHKKL